MGCAEFLGEFDRGEDSLRNGIVGEVLSVSFGQAFVVGYILNGVVPTWVV